MSSFSFFFSPGRTEISRSRVISGWLPSSYEDETAQTLTDPCAYTSTSTSPSEPAANEHALREDTAAYTGAVVGFEDEDGVALGMWVSGEAAKETAEGEDADESSSR